MDTKQVVTNYHDAWTSGIGDQKLVVFREESIEKKDKNK